MNSPVEPSASLRQGAAQLRQLYIALANEGFTETQALTLIGKILLAQQGGSDD